MNHAFYCRFGTHVFTFAALSIVAVLLVAPHAIAQQPASNYQAHQTSLARQLQELQAKVGRLEAALKQNHQAAANLPRQSGGAGGQGMGMTDDDMGEMGPMQPSQRTPGTGGMGGGSMQPGQGMPAAGGMGMMEDDMGEMGAMQPGQAAPPIGGMTDM
jgi:hypothetical protein